jgi:transcriptional regulator with XRE-family HTH domain
MSQSILSTNLKALMQASEDLRSQAALGKRCGIDQRTVGRILNEEHSPQLKQIEAIAQAFGLFSWQLLVPDLDPKNPPVCELTTVEKELYDKLRRLVKQLPPG